MKTFFYFPKSIGCLLIAFLLSLPVNASEKPNTVPLAEKPAKNLIIKADKIYNPDILSLDSLAFYSKSFTLDWHKLPSISLNQAKIAEIETFLQNTPTEKLDKLSTEEKNLLGTMLQKMGAYYVHYTHQPDLAIAKLTTAQHLLESSKKTTGLAWNYGCLAFAYEQRLEATGDPEDQTKALDYVDKVLSLYQKDLVYKEVAFAYCVRGLVANEKKDYAEAEANFNNALKIYEQIAKDNDIEVIRAKNKLASILIDEKGPNDEALDKLLAIEKYWLSQPGVLQNPYAARNFLALGHAYLKMGKATEARKEFEKVISIYTKIYGTNTELLVKPYQLLSDTFNVLGQQQLAEAYQIKSNLLDQSET